MSFELLGLAVAIGVPLIGAIVRLGKLVQTVKDHDRRLLTLEADDAAENAARMLRTRGADE